MAKDEEGVIAVARFKIRTHRSNAQGGRIVKTMGDGLLIEFASAVAAVRTAVSIQKAMVLNEADRAEDRCLRFRVGINLGDIAVDGDDVLGDCVNVAARLETLAPVGGI